MAKRARVHHLIPEFYLLRFADENGAVLVTDKQTGERKRVAPRVLMTERDYYTVETVEGASDAIEKTLSTLEGAAAEVLRKIDGGVFPPAGDDLAAISTFLAFQMLRGRVFQQSIETMVQGTTELQAMGLAAYPEALRQVMRETQGREPTNEEVAEQQEYIREALKDKRIETSVPRSYTVGLMIQTAPRVASILAQRAWSIVETDRPAFIVGDVPLALWTKPELAKFGVGVMTADEITFAVDPHRSILLLHPNETAIRFELPASAAAIKGMNERQYYYARRFTFQHPSDQFTVESGPPDRLSEDRPPPDWKA